MKQNKLFSGRRVLDEWTKALDMGYSVYIYIYTYGLDKPVWEPQHCWNSLSPLLNRWTPPFFSIDPPAPPPMDLHASQHSDPFALQPTGGTSVVGGPDKYWAIEKYAPSPLVLTRAHTPHAASPDVLIPGATPPIHLYASAAPEAPTSAPLKTAEVFDTSVPASVVVEECH